MGRCIGWPVGWPGERFKQECNVTGTTVVSHHIKHKLHLARIRNRHCADAHPVVVLALILLMALLLVVLLAALPIVALLTLLGIALLCLVVVFLALLLWGSW